MGRPYTVIVGDCAGERSRQDFASFAEATDYAAFVHRELRSCRAFVVNTDRQDVGSDGLTDEEREAL